MLPQKKNKRHLAAVPDSGPIQQTLQQTMDLDRLIHERLRLGIVSALAVNQSLSFNDLKMILNTSDGNLSVHARKLENAGYIQCKKSFEGRVPHTEYAITHTGRQALEHYLHHMESLIETTRQVHP
jgi:DNA-binding HxlR family transcriptional regulator